LKIPKATARPSRTAGWAATIDFDILGIDIFAADNQHVLATANDKEFAPGKKDQVPCPVPPFAHHLRRQVLAMEIALEQRVAFDQNLYHRAWRQRFTRLGHNLNLISRQRLAGRSEGNRSL
jgi:hypothetical protein